VIDQTNLTLGCSRDEIAAFAEQAVAYGFHAVCVLSNMVPYVARVVAGTSTTVAGCVSFPMGMDIAATKAFEAREAQEMGATEIDMVICTGRARAVDSGYLESEVEEVRAVVPSPHLLKVIIEMPLLNREQAIAAAQAVESGGADFVKTSTGFKGLKIRATLPEDVALLRSVLRPETGIKAAGGIRSLDDVEALVELGATRIGTSSGVGILEAYRRRTR
jgi:deoxyribose-phosphate aldolase